MDVPTASLVVPAERPLRIALVCTSMGLVESTKETRYHENLVRPKFPTPQFGVFRLQHFLQRELADATAVDVLDPCMMPPVALHEAIRRQRYHVIGFSPIRIASGHDLQLMRAVHEASREANPLYLAGGIEAATNSHHLFRLCPWLHFCIAGFGEISLQDIIREILAREPGAVMSLSDCLPIRGIIGRSGESIVRTPCNLTHAEFDRYNTYTGENIPYPKYWAASRALLPPELVDLPENNVETVRLYTSSSCHNSCTFCGTHRVLRGFFGGKVHSQSPQEIANAVRSVQERTGARGIYFNDEEIFSSKPRTMETLQRLASLRQNGSLRRDTMYYGQTRVDSVDEDVAVLAAEAGFFYLSYGVESFSTTVLQGVDMDKGYTGETAESHVRISLRHLPVTNLNLILFPPLIDIAGFVRTVEACCDLIGLAIELGHRLSLTPFLFVEAYMGAPSFEIGRKHGWPVEIARMETPTGEMLEEPLCFLPVKEPIREALRGGALVSKSHEVYQRLVRCGTLPGRMISRLIGVNALVLFISAYSLLEISESQSAVTIADMEELIRGLVRRFAPP